MECGKTKVSSLDKGVIEAKGKMDSEKNISGNKNSICFQLQNIITFYTRRVTKEETLLGPRSKLISVVGKCLNEAQTPKSSKMIIGW